MQANGWERNGKAGNFRRLCQALQAVFDAPDAELRDEIVKREMTALKDERTRLWRACFSELLCHFFPKEYPVWNEPVKQWSLTLGLSRSSTADPGETYLVLAHALREALRSGAPDVRTSGIANLALLDAVLWQWNERRRSRRSTASAAFEPGLTMLDAEAAA